MLNFLKNTLKNIYASITSRLQELYGQPLDESTLAELERILIQADAGVKTTRNIIHNVREHSKQSDGQPNLKNLLTKELLALLPPQKSLDKSRIFLMVGVNGAGKTTCSAKLAYYHTQRGRRVLLVAADTFRAAAVEQLSIWAHRLGVTCVTGMPDADPASVVFAGCQKFIEGQYDILIIDTAGRLQNKGNLMRELEKMHNVIKRKLPSHELATLLTIDTLIGQNSLDQARLFHEATTLDGIILTKMDSTAKGGIIFSVAHELHVPIYFITYGEKITDFDHFSAEKYVYELLNG